ncbi:MAG: tRNA lysidine(34) synthetase TilS [Chloroflexi bacterium]|nr:tRNA lysidine(34) synthetase TilS [Chloroflexota bacterium]
MGGLTLPQRVERALEQAGLLSPPGQTLLVAVSGGPDSLALLLLLHELARARPFRLHVAHLDHGLRGKESEEDARFVQATCQRLQVPATIQRTDVAALRARRRLSWEAAAREARYAFLARVAREEGAAAVAVGHTADDQGETVLLHLLRGSGLRGLRGMAPSSWWRGPDGARVRVVRPLLEVSHQETEAFCQSRGVTPRYDATNLDSRFTRNRVRLELVPSLRRYNPAIVDALNRLAKNAAQALAYLEEQVQQQWSLLVAREPWGLRIDRKGFLALHPALQAHLLQRAYAELLGEGADLSHAHVATMLELAQRGAGRSLALPRGVRWSTSYQDLLLTEAHPELSWPPVRETALPIPGEVLIPGWRIRVQTSSPSSGAQPPRAQDPFCASLDIDAIGATLMVRGRRPGDRFQPLGMEGTKRLKEFMIDAHIPQAWRDRVPLVVGEGGIAWVVGWRIAHWARVTPETQVVLRVSFSRQGPERD